MISGKYGIKAALRSLSTVSQGMGETAAAASYKNPYPTMRPRQIASRGSPLSVRSYLNSGTPKHNNADLGLNLPMTHRQVHMNHLPPDMFDSNGKLILPEMFTATEFRAAALNRDLSPLL